LRQLPGPERPGVLRRLLQAELACRLSNGERVTATEYERRLPGYLPLIEELFADASTTGFRGREAFAPSDAPTAAASPAGPLFPERFGRYRVLGRLGSGGFGV